MDTQRPQIEKAILSRKNTAEEHSIILFYLKLHYKAMVTKSASCWYKHRHVDQWNIMKTQR